LYDAVIVGGGPCGSLVAKKLAENGFTVVVMEKKEGPDMPVCCTGIVGRECVELFDIDENVIHGWANSASLLSPLGKKVRVYREKPQAAILDRAAFNTMMAERAQNNNADYWYDCEVENVSIEDDKVKIGVTKQKEPVELEARVIVIANGFGSKLAGDLGLGSISDFVMGAQAEVEVENLEEVEVYFGKGVAPSFFAWLVPTAPGKALAGLLSRRSPGIHLRKLIASLTAEKKIGSDNVILSYGGVPLKPLPRTHANRALVVGTAAGQVKPTTGGGIYFGLLGADIAADTLNKALTDDDLSSTALASYERGWREKLGRELRTGYWMRKFYEMLTDKQVDGIFNLMQTSGILEELLEEEDLSFDWHGNVASRIFNHRVFLKAIGTMKIRLNLKGLS